MLFSSCGSLKMWSLRILTIALLTLSKPAHSGVWQFLFGLSGDNTTYDFMAAPDSRSVAFIMKLCDGGVCLNELDWKCGFENNEDDNKVEDCFWSMIKKVPPWVRLDQVRKFCGVSLAQFAGARGEVNPERCAAAGGKWGTKSKVSLPGISR